MKTTVRKLAAVIHDGRGNFLVERPDTPLYFPELQMDVGTIPEHVKKLLSHMSLGLDCDPIVSVVAVGSLPQPCLSCKVHASLWVVECCVPRLHAYQDTSLRVHTYDNLKEQCRCAKLSVERTHVYMQVLDWLEKR